MRISYVSGVLAEGSEGGLPHTSHSSGLRASHDGRITRGFTLLGLLLRNGKIDESEGDLADDGRDWRADYDARRDAAKLDGVRHHVAATPSLSVAGTDQAAPLVEGAQ